MHIVTVRRYNPEKTHSLYSEMQTWAITHCASYIGDDIHPTSPHLVDFAFKKESDAMIFKLKYD